MARRGPVRIPDLEDEPERDLSNETPAEVVLPPADVLNAGLQKFYELAKLHWPNKDQSVSFDYKNERMLRVTLGLVYSAMKSKDVIRCLLLVSVLMGGCTYVQSYTIEPSPAVAPELSSRVREIETVADVLRRQRALRVLERQMLLERRGMVP